MVVPPIWDDENHYRDERQRQEIVGRNVRSERRRSLLLIIGGALLLACMLPAVLAGWPGLGIIIVPTGMFMLIGGAIQFFFERG